MDVESGDGVRCRNEDVENVDGGRSRDEEKVIAAAGVAAEPAIARGEEV